MCHLLAETVAKKKEMNLRDMTRLFILLFITFTRIFTIQIEILGELCYPKSFQFKLSGSKYTPKNGFCTPGEVCSF